MFKNKIIKNNQRKKHCRRKFYKIFQKKGSNVLILSKEDISLDIFEDMTKVVESDLHIGDFNYKGRTVLQIQLLANVENKNKITLIRVKNKAILIIKWILQSVMLEVPIWNLLLFDIVFYFFNSSIRLLARFFLPLLELL